MANKWRPQMGCKEHGGSLLYAMFFAMIMAIAATQLYRSSDFNENNVQSERVMSTRESLQRRLNTLASVDDTIFASSTSSLLNPTVNAALRRCLTGANCTALGPQRRAPVVLIDAAGNWLAGTSPLAAGYDIKGNACNSPGCAAFLANAWFYASCRNNAATCQLPEQIHTIVQIKYIGGVRSGRNGRLADVPTDQALAANPAAFANTNFVQNIVKQKKTCPVGSILTQVKGGAFGCTCTGKTLSIDANGLPVCQTVGNTCAVGEILTGVTGLGQPQCLSDVAACVKMSGTVSMTCTNDGCMQNTPLVVQCGKIARGPLRLAGVVMPTASNTCNSLNDPAKKAKNAAPNVKCSVVYTYKCCG